MCLGASADVRCALAQDGHINAFLKIIEAAFVYQAPAVRAEAFRSWVSLAQLFNGMNSTLAHPKRLELVLSPLSTALENEASASVRRAALHAWSRVAKMIAKGSQVERSFAAVFARFFPVLLRDADATIRSEGLRLFAAAFGTAKRHAEPPQGASKSAHSVFPAGLPSSVLSSHLAFFLSLLAAPALYAPAAEQQQQRDLASGWVAVLRWVGEEAATLANEEQAAAHLELVVCSLAQT
eukprot:1673625-Rhodomonas_salina.1